MARPIYTPVALRDVGVTMSRAIADFGERMRTCGRLKLEPDRLFAVCKSYANAPSIAIDTILATREPSSVAHLMIGLGDYVYDGVSATSRIGIFLDRTATSGTCIRQDNVGTCDYHPWQTFAYAALAGVQPDIHIADSGATMRTLAINSRRIVILGDKLYDLGHLLVGSAFLVPDQDILFHLNGERISLRKLTERLLSVHQTNSRSTVCSDYHLTEGLVLATTLVPGLQHLRAEVHELLDQQLLTLSLLGVYLSKVAANKNDASREIDADDGIVQKPCQGVYCNHCGDVPHWIGHALELAALAQIYGFDLTTEQLNTVAFVANHASRFFMDGLFSADFSTIAHWRRALTLLLELERARNENRSLATVDFARYAVNLD
ncbi:MAG: hypothetical protein ABID61_02320 [Candidatus Micrarchaeota archaeon]